MGHRLGTLAWVTLTALVATPARAQAPVCALQLRHNDSLRVWLHDSTLAPVHGRLSTCSGRSIALNAATASGLVLPGTEYRRIERLRVRWSRDAAVAVGATARAITGGLLAWNSLEPTDSEECSPACGSGVLVRLLLSGVGAVGGGLAGGLGAQALPRQGWQLVVTFDPARGPRLGGASGSLGLTVSVPLTARSP